MNEQDRLATRIAPLGVVHQRATFQACGIKSGLRNGRRGHATVLSLAKSRPVYFSPRRLPTPTEAVRLRPDRLPDGPSASCPGRVPDQPSVAPRYKTLRV